ncbi:MAG: DnaJ C-terminal domain-containing protein, partial [bacterium]
YQTLGNTEKRKRYDQFGNDYQRTQAGGFGQGFQGFNGFQGMDFDFDLGDVFGDVFGMGRREKRSKKGRDLETELVLDFKEAVFGIEKKLSLRRLKTCQACKGSGAEAGAKVVNCSACHGRGQVERKQQTFFGTFASVSTCPDCDGLGKRPEKACRHCKGSGTEEGMEEIMVKVPAGIDNGQTLRLQGRGEAGERGQESGDLYVRIKVKPDKTFQRQGDDILSTINVSMAQAALGAEVEVMTVDGVVKLTIPSGTQHGTVLKLKDKGVWRLGRSGRGDMLVTVQVEIPRKLSREQKRLLEEFAKN